ncbi:Glycerol-3-phosphate acyltransferase [Diplonema papillatum]|nr:Glycerol-3-phosphate acyltransferase [Diplonema papillatum]
MELRDWYRGKTVLVSGAEGPVAQYFVRELLRTVYPDVKRLHLLLNSNTAVASSESPGEVLRAYAALPVFGSLYQEHPGQPAGGAEFDWFVDFLEGKTSVASAALMRGADLGLDAEYLEELHASVDVIFHTDCLLDPCDVDVDADVVHMGGTSICAFAAKCRQPEKLLVLPGSLHAAAVGRRMRDAPLEFSPVIPEEPATGIRSFLSERNHEGMPTPLISALAVLESLASTTAAQGDTARLAVVRHTLIGPPSRHPVNTHLLGGFDSLAFAVAVGGVSSLKLRRGALVDVIPVDFLAERLLFAPLVASQRQDPVVVMHAGTSGVHPLALEMVSKYFTDYLSRNGRALAAALDVGLATFDASPQPIRTKLSPVLAARPALRIGRTGHLRGTLAAGAAAGLQYLQPGSSRFHLSHHPHAASASRFRASYTRAVRLSAALEKSVAMLQHAFDCPAVLPYAGATDLRIVDWETYCQTTARLSFLHLCRVLGVDPPSVPQPTRYCDADRLMCRPGVAFAAPVNVLHWLFPDLHFIVRCIRQPDGSAVKYKPGLSLARRGEILALPSVRRAISDQTASERVDEEAIVARAHAILDRIGDRLNMNTLRLLGIGLRKAMKMLYTNIHTNPDAYEMVRRAYQGIGSLRPQGKRALVLIPSHRSYMDFLVVSYLMYTWGLPVPHICAGEDFLQMSVVSSLLRGSGAFFMRRSFKGDKLYATLFREYTRLLATDGRVIEFFIEGARSRLGKTMPPKLGILKIMYESLIEAVQSGNSDFVDVVFVPVSLSYDKVLEAGVYLREFTGEKKPPETLSNLVASASILRNQFGTLNVTVGKPISLADFVLNGDRGGTRSLPGLTRPVALIRDRPDRQPDKRYDQNEPLETAVAAMTANRHREVLASLAYRITADLQSGLVVTPTSLLSAALLFLHLPSEVDRGIHFDVVVSDVVWLRELVLKSGGHMKPEAIRQDGESLLGYAADLLDPYVQVSSLAVVRMSPEHLPLLQIYANQLVHLFSDRGVLCVSAVSLVPSTSEQKRKLSVPLKELSEKACFVKDLLRLEYPDYSGPSPLSHDQWFDQAVRAAGGDGGLVTGDALTLPRDSPLVTFLMSTLYPVVECYWFVAASLMSLQGAPKVREPEFFERMAAAVDELIGKGVLHFRTAANREILKTALARMKGYGVIDSSLVTGTHALALAGRFASNDANALLDLLEDLNSIRWEPSKELRRDVSVLVHHLQPPKL